MAKFQKGQSGNPTGRPKHVLADGRSVADLAREHTADALAVLIEVMENPTAAEAARVSAANSVLDRGWGRPKQDMDINVKTDPMAILEEARARVHGNATQH